MYINPVPHETIRIFVLQALFRYQHNDLIPCIMICFNDDLSAQDLCEGRSFEAEGLIHDPSKLTQPHRPTISNACPLIFPTAVLNTVVQHRSRNTTWLPSTARESPSASLMPAAKPLPLTSFLPQMLVSTVPAPRIDTCISIGRFAAKGLNGFQPPAAPP